MRSQSRKRPILQAVTKMKCMRKRMLKSTKCRKKKRDFKRVKCKDTTLIMERHQQRSLTRQLSLKSLMRFKSSKLRQMSSSTK